MKTAIKVSLVIFIFLFFLLGISIGLMAFYQPVKVINFLQSLHPTPTVTPVHIKGIGVIGDSLSDEYRADDSRGQTYASTTLNWVEILVRSRHLNFGPWGVREEPRREGYAYNFARTGSSIAWAVETGQHTGLAEEIKKGNVNVVVIAIGVNDFSPLAENGYESIYNGTMTDEEVRRKVNRIGADMRTVVETLQSANPRVRILLVLIPNWSRNPIVQLAFPLPDGKSRVEEAISSANDQLITLAKERNSAVADLNSFDESVEKRTKGDTIIIGGVSLNKFIPGDDPRDMFLSDGVHPGTIYNGLLANFVISNLNTQLGTSIRPLSDTEILEAAGL